MDQKKIGIFIAKCRKNKKMTQMELGEKLGVTEKSISNWENGRNMPDLSLFKPLCEELDITINDLMSGEKIKKDEYQEKFEENIIKTIDYTNKKINDKNNLIGILLIVFGVLISVTAIAIFPSDSSWGGAYSVFGGIISLIGVSKFTKKLEYDKRLLCNFCYFILFLFALFLIDFIGVVNIKQAPRFTLETTHTGTDIYYDTLFYDVIRCSPNTNVESWHIEKNKDFDKKYVYEYCFTVKKERFNDLIEYAKDNSTVLVISKLADYEKDNKQYVRDLNNSSHELIEVVESKEKINEIIDIIMKAKYPENVTLPGYSYLFQLFDKDNNLILEFKENYIQTKDEIIYISLDDKEIDRLKKLYK